MPFQAGGGAVSAVRFIGDEGRELARGERRHGERESVRGQHQALIAIIHKEYGDFPLAALDDRRTRPEMLAWRDRLAATSARQADYA